MATAVYDPARPGVLEIEGEAAENRIVPLAAYSPRPPAPCSLAGTGWHHYPGSEWEDAGRGRWARAVFRFPQH